MCFDRFPLLIRISSMGQLTDFKGYKELILNNTVMRFSMDTIKKKKNILKLLVSAVVVLCWGIFFLFAFGLGLALLLLLCFLLSFVFSVLLCTCFFLLPQHLSSSTQSCSWLYVLVLSTPLVRKDRSGG